MTVTDSNANMSVLKPSVLRFLLKTTGNPLELMSRFHPRGKSVLNRTEWHGKPPRSCAITSVKSRPHAAGSGEPVIVDIEVTYRPKGVTAYVGRTKYDGWTAMILDQTRDGTLLDGHGKPLPEGQPPVYLPFELYEDIDFNEIDFGEFLGEFDLDGIRHIQFGYVIEQMLAAGLDLSVHSTFIAQRRHRPPVKIVLSSAPSQTRSDRFGTRIVNISNLTPHLQQVLLDELTDLLSGFIEGRYSIKNASTDDFVFVDLDDAFVDCTGSEPKHDCIGRYIPDTWLEDLAKRLSAIYEIEVSVVDGPKAGLLFQKAARPPRD